MRRDDLSDDFIPLSAPKIHGNLIRKGLKIQREGRGQLPLPKMNPWGCWVQASRSHAGATRAVPKGHARRGQWIETPKSPRESTAAPPASIIPSRDSSRDMPGWGGEVARSPSRPPFTRVRPLE